MQKIFKNDLFIVFIIFIIFAVCLPFFFLHQGLLAVDTGREFYLSQQVANGAVLYQNIFNIYGPFAYQLNALLFNIFGEKIHTLYWMGIINSFVIVVSLYFIAREFLKKSFSFLISIFTVFSLVYTTFLYNSNITYSYGLIYALSSFLLSLLFFIKYLKNDSYQYIYLSCFFAGLSIINKYEFILYPFLLIYVLFFLKPIDLKTKIKSIICFFIMPFLSFGILFFQGLTIEKLKEAFELMTIMAKSDNMRLFYSNFGNFFEPYKYILLILRNPFSAIFGFLPIINIILFLVFLKKIKNNTALIIFCIASILASIKFILFLNIEHMGAFLFPLCLLTSLILCENFDNITNLKYIFLSALILFYAYNDFDSLQYKNYLLETPKGNIYTFRKDGEPIKTVSDYIIQNSNEDDKVVILPEGAFINFITDRKSDNILHNLVPLYYTDTFGENKVLNHYEKYPADYFVIMPLTTIEYGSNFFCDYAKNFCEMINNNYSLEQEINNIKIYKRK